MNAAQRQEISDLEQALREISTIPDLRVLTGRSVWWTYGRQLSGIWRRHPGAVITSLMVGVLAIVAVVFAGQGIVTAFAGGLLIVLLPLALVLILISRSRRLRSITLVTDRAHLVVAIRTTRRGLVLEPTDHWVDRLYENGERLKGQATEFRRSVLLVLANHVLEHGSTVKARARNKKVREIYTADLKSLGLDPLPFLRGGIRLYVTRELLRASIGDAAGRGIDAPIES